MRILVVGAGAVGGYFGGRLLEAGRDVTFLLRPARAAQLAATGLAIRSPCGDVSLAAPHCLVGEVAGAFDVVVLSCKAQALALAVDAMAPAVGEASAVLPLLNGMAHLDVLDARLAAAAPDPWETSDFHCRELAADLYLLTYTLRQGRRLTRRATIWRRTSDGWKIAFHQGTEVAPE